MVRIGIAGIGFMGRIHYLASQRLTGAKVTAVCSRDPAKLAGVPVAVAHGSLDPVIPSRFGAEAAETLAAAGADVVRLETDVPHMVDPAWIEPLREVVARATTF